MTSAAELKQPPHACAPSLPTVTPALSALPVPAGQDRRARATAITAACVARYRSADATSAAS